MPPFYSPAGLLLLFATRVAAHGYVTLPAPRPHTGTAPVYRSDVDPVYDLSGPVFGTSATSMRCADDAAVEPLTTITAGQAMAYTVLKSAKHIGDCSFYLSSPCTGVACDAPEQWFKIASLAGCPESGSIIIPSVIPSSTHSVLRWEWHAHHVVAIGKVEFYVKCVDVRIASSATAPVLPAPWVAVSGVAHMPTNASLYHDAAEYGQMAGNEVGPAVATFTSCTPGSSGCLSGTTDTDTGGLTPTNQPSTTDTVSPTVGAKAGACIPAPAYTGCGRLSADKCCTEGHYCQEYDSAKDVAVADGKGDWAMCNPEYNRAPSSPSNPAPSAASAPSAPSAASAPSAPTVGAGGSDGASGAPAMLMHGALPGSLLAFALWAIV